MDDNLRKDISESILRHAVIKNHNKEMAAFPSNEELARMYTFSEQHNKRMNTLFKRVHFEETCKKVFVATKWIAAILVITLTGFFGALMTSPDVRAAVRQTIIEWYEQFTLFNFTESNELIEFSHWFPTHLPDGFEKEDMLVLGELAFLRFLHQDGRYILLQYGIAAGVGFGVDNEYVEFEIVWLNGIEYHILRPTLEGDQYAKILWYADGHAFLLQSSIIAEELLRVAVSIEN